MLAAWVVVAFSICNAVLGQGVNLPPKTITYRITIRDFLPAACMRKSDYAAAWRGVGRAVCVSEEMYDDWSQDPFSIQFRDSSNDLSKTNQDGISKLNGFGFPNTVGFENITWGDYCPYFDAMRTGQVSGHPDFGAHWNQLGIPDSKFNKPELDCHFGGEARLCRGKMISGSLTLTHSGIRKVQHCSATNSCKAKVRDRFGSSPLGQYFDSWFNDNAKYNKRVGAVLELVRNEDGHFEYSRSGNRAMGPDFQYFPLDKYIGTVNMSSFPEWHTAPVWPSSFTGQPASNYKHYPFPDLDRAVPKFGFTTEMHTYFKYSGNETLQFEGDDDLWVFINGKPAIDIGGVHGKLSRAIELSQYAGKDQLDLQVGGVYELNLFHAERRYSESNFKLTTALVGVCNVIQSGTAAFRQSNSSSSDWALVGHASAAGEPGTTTATAVIDLTDARGSKYSSSSAFLNEPVNVGSGFIASFSFEAVPDGQHKGLAFVLHNRPEGLDSMPSTTGSSLNANFLSNALVLAIDLCTHRGSSNTTCAGQQIGLYYDKNRNSSRLHDDRAPLLLNAENLVVHEQIARSLSIKGEKHTVRVEYFSTPDTMDIFIDESLYLRARHLNLSTVLLGQRAFVGLTSVTGASPATLRVSDFDVDSVFVQPANTDAFDLGSEALVYPLSHLDKSDEYISTNSSDGAFAEILADGESAATLNIRTRDLCFNQMQVGGNAHLMHALFVESRPEPSQRYDNNSLTPRILDAEIIDNDDGTYGARLASNYTGIFDLWVCFGPSCDLTVHFGVAHGSEEGPVLFANVSAGSGPSLNHEDMPFFAVRRHAVRAVSVGEDGEPVNPEAVEEPQSKDILGMAPFLFAAAMGGGVLCCGTALCAPLVVYYRRKWARAKYFVDPGKLSRLERDCVFYNSSEATTLGHQLFTTRAAVLRERAQNAGSKAGEQVAGEVHELSQTNAALHEQIDIMKGKKKVGALQIATSLGGISEEQVQDMCFSV